MITIKKENYFSDLGKNSINEDSFAYIPGSTYLVCDGSGGLGKGDIASKVVVKCFIESFRENPNFTVEEVLKEAESKLTQYISENPGTDGLGTTLAFAQIRNNGVYIGWVGNSRIYQFRNGHLIYLTEDHNWTGEALKAGLITEEEVVDHPKKNVITRSIQGNHRTTKADSGLLGDIQRGDIFLLATAGVHQSWSNEELVELFKDTTDLDELRAQLISKCVQRADDNYTGVLLQVHDARIPASDQSSQDSEVAIEQLLPNNPPVAVTSREEKKITGEKTVTISNSEETNESGFSLTTVHKKIIAFAILLLLILMVVWKWPSKSESPKFQVPETDSTKSSAISASKDSIKGPDSSNSDTLTKSRKKTKRDKQEIKVDSVLNKSSSELTGKSANKTKWKKTRKKKKSKKSKTKTDNSDSDLLNSAEQTNTPR